MLVLRRMAECSSALERFGFLVMWRHQLTAHARRVFGLKAFQAKCIGGKPGRPAGMVTGGNIEWVLKLLQRRSDAVIGLCELQIRFWVFGKPFFPACPMLCA